MPDLNEGITLNGVSHGILIYLVIAQALGTCFNILILVGFFRSRSLFNANNLLTTHIFFAEAIFGITLSYFDTINIGQTENHVSYVACQVTGAIVMTCACVMIFTLVFSAYYRYLIIVHERPSVQLPTMFLILGSFWMICPAGGLLPVLPDGSMIDRHTQANFGGACLPRYATRKPLGLTLAIVTFMVIFLTPLNIAYAYYSIWKKLHQVHIRIKNLLNVGTYSHPIDGTETELDTTRREVDPTRAKPRNRHIREKDNLAEREILKRGILISSLFGIGWCPLACIWLYECITMSFAPYYITGFAHMMVATHSFVSPLIIVSQDKMYRTAVFNVINPTFAFFADSPTGYPLSNTGTKTVQQYTLGTSLTQSPGFDSRPSQSSIKNMDASTAALTRVDEDPDSSIECL